MPLGGRWGIKMRVNFTGDLALISLGLEALIKDLDIVQDINGYPVEVRQEGEGFYVSVSNNGALICYKDKPCFFRALGYLTSHWHEEGFEVKEIREFDTVGVMVDASRNAVPTVETIKRLLDKMALMGINMLMLYTEDTYEVPEYPYMGYMRGKYTFDELKACDDYADIFGIEIIPCIQTLAHLPRMLQWKCFEKISDTPDILLADEPDTYSFIEKSITSAASPFRSNKIHIGMDEAHFVGLGNYLTKHGPQNRFSILNRHLAKVVEIAKKHCLTPIMWSDMYFRLVDPSGDYAAEEIPQEVIEQIPEPVQLVYWDYFNSDKDFYLRKLRQHNNMKKGTAFAGGIWTWNGMAVSYSKSLITTLPAIEACKQAGVKELIVTLWGDDGSETDFLQALLGIQLYAELAYTSGPFNMEKLKIRFRECTSGDPEAFLDLDNIDNIHSVANNEIAFNTSKLALYQDVMLGLFDRHFQGMNLSQHYSKLANSFKEYADAKNPWSYLFVPIARLCEVLAVKADMGIELKSAYDLGNINAIKAILQQLDLALQNMFLMKDEYRKLWLRDFKPFGFEVMDIRLGGVIARLEYAKARLQDYIEGKVDRLPELEENRLFHDCREESLEGGLCRFNRWHQTVTTSYIGHNIP